MSIDFNSDKVEKMLEEFSNIKTDTIFKFSEVIGNYGEHAEFCMKNKVHTGFPTIDKLLYGIQPSEVVYIVSKTDVGKTSFLMNFIRNNLMGNSVIPYLSLENSEMQMFERMVQMELGVPFYETQRHFINKDYDFIKKCENIVKLWDNCINIVRRVDLSQIVPYIKVVETLTGKKSKVLVIDYFQLIKSKGNSYEQSTDIAQTLKEISLQLRLPVLVASQTSRAYSKGKEHQKLDLYSGKGSGSLEDSAQIYFTLEDTEEIPIELSSDIGLTRLVESGKAKLLTLTPHKLKRRGKKVPIHLIMHLNTLKIYEYGQFRSEIEREEELPF